MKLYEIIAKEFSDDENYKKLGEVLCTNPVEAGVSEHVYREAFINSVGYDPTTVYDEERILVQEKAGTKYPDGLVLPGNHVDLEQLIKMYS